MRRWLKKKWLNVVQSIDYWQRVDFLGGKIEGIPGTHGYGFIAKPAGPVMGFYIELPKQPSIYLSSDAIFTADVDKVLREYDPSISVVACGSNQFERRIFPESLPYLVYGRLPKSEAVAQAFRGSAHQSVRCLPSCPVADP